jgi:hypothetical protein
VAPLYKDHKGRPQISAVAAVEFPLLSKAIRIRVSRFLVLSFEELALSMSCLGFLLAVLSEQEEPEVRRGLIYIAKDMNQSLKICFYTYSV